MSSNNYFKNEIPYNLFAYTSYIYIYIYIKQDLALNNLQELIYHKTLSNYWFLIISHNVDTCFSQL